MDSPTQTEQLDIHSYFGLSYANYLVLHRTLMQSMPEEWQHRFVGCVEELNEAFDHVEKASVFEVIPAREVEYDMLTADERKYLGVRKSRHTDPIYWDKDGNEHQGDERALLPTRDPIPHYNRGREFIAPALPIDRSKDAMDHNKALYEEAEKTTGKTTAQRVAEALENNPKKDS